MKIFLKKMLIKLKRLLQKSLYMVMKLDNKLYQIKIYRIVKEKLLSLYRIIKKLVVNPIISVIKFGHSRLALYRQQQLRLFKQQLTIVIVSAIIVILGYGLFSGKGKPPANANKTVQLAEQTSDIDNSVFSVLSDFDARLMTLAKQVNQLHDQQVIEYDTKAIEQRFDRIEEKLTLMVGLENFELFQAQMEQDRQLIDELFQLVQTISQESNENTVPPNQQLTTNIQPEPKLPFQISSIERWGDRIYALLVMDDIKNLASIGDVRAGWRIKELDPYQESALFVNEKSGITIQAFTNRH